MVIARTSSTALENKDISVETVICRRIIDVTPMSVSHVKDLITEEKFKKGLDSMSLSPIRTDVQHSVITVAPFCMDLFVRDSTVRHVA